MKMWIARDEDGALFIFKERPFLEDDGEQKIWMIIGAESCIGINCKLFPEVTFENSPQQVEIKLVKPRKKPEPYKSEYAEFEGVVQTVYKSMSMGRNYSVSCDHPRFEGICREFALKQGIFNKKTAPKVGDRVLLRYRKTKRHSGSGKESFDFWAAKIVKVL